MFYEIFFTSDICEAIHVTGDTSTTYALAGLYELSNERSSGAPNSPVWKNSAGNRFIFTDGNSNGWRIGDKKDLTNGGYYCKSKHILISFTIAKIYFEYLCA